MDLAGVLNGLQKSLGPHWEFMGSTGGKGRDFTNGTLSTFYVDAWPKPPRRVSLTPLLDFKPWTLRAIERWHYFDLFYFEYASEERLSQQCRLYVSLFWESRTPTESQTLWDRLTQDEEEPPPGV